MTAPPLLDTDILVDVARQVDEAVSYLAAVEADTTPMISAVTQMELIVGCGNKTELRRTEKFLRRFRVLPVGEEVSDTAVDLLRRYRLSHGLAIPDALIAATALALGHPFATKNRRDYRFISDLKLLPYP
mgnify:CR=1 FL=1